MSTLFHQKQIRELSERYLTNLSGGVESRHVNHEVKTPSSREDSAQTNDQVNRRPASCDSESSASPAQNLPSTLEELSGALQNPLPKPPTPPRCYSALEACKSYKPLTLKMVSDLLAKKRAARDAIIAEYVKRTGQQVDYCDQCDMGVAEEEHEEGWQTVVSPTECENCDGLGVVKL